MNPETVHYLNMFLGFGAIMLQIISAVTLGLLVWAKVSKSANPYLGFLKEEFISIGFLLAFIPALFSLFYSEVLNYAPCFHCWVQRMFLFPQVFLYAVAWFRKDRNVFWYSWPLLLVGFIDALYLNYIYYFNPSSAPCDATGVSCAQQFVYEFGGYISIPMLSITSFISLITLLLVVYFYKNENK